MTSSMPLLLRIAVLLLIAAGLPGAGAQTAPTPPPDSGTEQADVPPEQTPVAAKTSRAAALADAWGILDAALDDKKVELRISAVTAMGSIRESERAAAAVEKALTDNDRDVRLAAVVAAGTLQSRSLVPALRKTLDDPAADISFTASEVLWQMGDKSGQDILAEVASGERKGTPGFFKSHLHEANKDLHNPATLATIGAEQTAYALMGPFGIGLDAARLIVKSNGSENSARVTAITLLARDNSPLTNRQLISALDDKDYFVRAAAARALGGFHNDDTMSALLSAFSDPKPLVRLMAAAGYSRSSNIALRRLGSLDRVRWKRLRSCHLQFCLRRTRRVTEGLESCWKYDQPL
jgi:HEAT repeats